MGDIVRSQTDAATAPSGAIESYRDNLALSGQPVDYVENEFSFRERWDLLSPSIREWATGRAGQPINDPLTGTPKQYWWCVVRRSDNEPGGSASSATYDLVMFGKRGLVVAKGTTSQLIPTPGATRWKTTRWDVPVDPTAVRHDHRQTAAPNTTAGDDRAAGGSPGSDELSSKANDLLGNAHTASMFGNLPAETQRFLLDPFVRSGTNPQDVEVHPTRNSSGGQRIEQFCVYLFNKRWVSFCYAQRSIPQGYSDDALNGAPWDVAAWTAPALVPGKDRLPATTP